MTGPYTPACPGCRTNDGTTFYSGCGGCQARKSHIEAQRCKAPQPTKDQIKWMDSTTEPQGKK